MLLSKENITLVNLITIQQAFGAGSVKAVKIFNLLRDADLLDDPFSKTQLKEVIDAKDAEKINSVDVQCVYKIIDDCVNNDVFIVTICDNNYPNCLRTIDDSPIVLYIKGQFVNFDEEPIISVVGPRKISDFGKKYYMATNNH